MNSNGAPRKLCRAASSGWCCTVRARGDARPDSDWDVAVFLQGTPSREDRNVLSDIGFDLMIEHGQHVQTIAIDSSRPPEHSSFLKNVHEDGIPA